MDIILIVNRQAADLLFCISEPLHVLISVSSDPVCVCVCVCASSDPVCVLHCLSARLWRACSVKECFLV